jgi:hypothetical protein
LHIVLLVEQLNARRMQNDPRFWQGPHTNVRICVQPGVLNAVSPEHNSHPGSDYDSDKCQRVQQALWWWRAGRGHPAAAWPRAPSVRPRAHSNNEFCLLLFAICAVGGLLVAVGAFVAERGAVGAADRGSIEAGLASWRHGLPLGSPTPAPVLVVEDSRQQAWARRHDGLEEEPRGGSGVKAHPSPFILFSVAGSARKTLTVGT